MYIISIIVEAFACYTDTIRTNWVDTRVTGCSYIPEQNSRGKIGITSKHTYREIYELYIVGEHFGRLNINLFAA